MDVTVFGGDLVTSAWAVPAVMLGFAVALLQVSLMARRRIVGQVDPGSARRQWWLMAAVFLLGAVGGVAFAMMEPRA